VDKRLEKRPNTKQISNITLTLLRILVTLALWLLLFVSIFTGYFSILFLLLVIVLTMMMLHSSWKKYRKDNK
jgi:hypothetical protein